MLISSIGWYGSPKGLLLMTLPNRNFVSNKTKQVSLYEECSFIFSGDFRIFYKLM